MNKTTTIFTSILLILAAVLIHYFVNATNVNLDEEWIGFFAGMCFGTGIILPFSLLRKKNKI
jgi:hypothetical protein